MAAKESSQWGDRGVTLPPTSSKDIEFEVDGERWGATPLQTPSKEIGGLSEIDSESFFCVFPRLMYEDRPMTLDDFALRNPSVAHALAHSLTMPNDRAILNQLSTLEVRLMGFQYLIGVIIILLFFFPLSFPSSNFQNWSLFCSQSSILLNTSIGSWSCSRGLRSRRRKQRPRSLCWRKRC